MGFADNRFYLYLCRQIKSYKEQKEMGHTSGKDIDKIIANGGITWGRGGDSPNPNEGKVKTKAKKKKYITGAHGSGSAMQKARYRKQRANRHK